MKTLKNLNQRKRKYHKTLNNEIHEILFKNVFVFFTQLCCGSPFLPSLNVAWLESNFSDPPMPPGPRFCCSLLCCTLNELLCRKSLFPEPPQRYTTIFFGSQPPQRYTTIFLTMHIICTKYQ